MGSSHAEVPATCLATKPPLTDSDTVVRVIYVAGSMRSGTTLLGQLLGSADGAVDIGEMTLLWTALVDDWTCACGSASTDCPVWAGVREDLAGAGMGIRELRGLQALVLSTVRTRRLPQLLRASGQGGAADSPDTARIAAAIREVTDSVAARSGASVVVETTKHLPGLLMRAHAGPSNLDVVHIVRDARGVVASNARSPRTPTRPGDPYGRSRTAAAALWSLENVLTAALSPRGASYTLVEYERLAENPTSILALLRQRLGLRWPTEFVEGDLVNVGSSHALVGNPSRLQSRRRRVAPDETWRATLSQRQAAAVKATTALPRHITMKLAIARDPANAW